MCWLAMLADLETLYRAFDSLCLSLLGSSRHSPLIACTVDSTLFSSYRRSKMMRIVILNCAELRMVKQVGGKVLKCTQIRTSLLSEKLVQQKKEREYEFIVVLLKIRGRRNIFM